MLSIIKEFIAALNVEIKELKQGRGRNPIPVYNGELIQDSINFFIYQFNLNNILTTMDNTPGEIEVNGRNYNCNVVTVSGQTVTLSLEENVGNKIPSAKLKINSWYLLEILKKKYEESGDNAEKFAMSLKLFSGKSKYLSINSKSNDYYFSYDNNLNDSQKKAIESSLNQSLCIIWGPPGTGKTRTIAKLVEKHLQLGRKVLLVSHSNNAVDEAMIMIGEEVKNSKEIPELYLDGKLVRFGFIKEELLKKISDKSLDMIMFDKIVESKSENLMREKSLLTNQLAQLSERLQQIKNVKNLNTSINEINSEIISIDNNLKDEKIKLSNLQNQIGLLLEKQGILKNKLLEAQSSSALKRFFLGLNPATIQSNLEAISRDLEFKLRERDDKQALLSKLNAKLNEIETQKLYIVKELERAFMLFSIKDIKEIDEKIVKIEKEINITQHRIKEIQNSIGEITDKVLSEARLIGTTLTQTYLAKQFESLTFDVLIIDEASMAPLPMLFWAASKASLAVTIVGDFMQLQPICISKEETAQKWLSKSIFDLFGINEVQKAFNDDRINLLDTQYRMHPIISEIPRELIYGNKLKDGKGTSSKSISDTISGRNPLILIDTSSDNPWASQASSGGRFNLYNALLCINLAEKILKKDDSCTISIITPYRNQANLIIKMAIDKGEWFSKKLRINTIHSFQGSEDEIVFFDTVEGPGVNKWSMLNEYDYEDAKKLINVAITRAKSKLYIVANKNYILNNFSQEVIISKMLNKVLKKGIIKPSNQIIRNWYAQDLDKWIDKLYLTAYSESTKNSKQYDETNFWPAFYDDLKSANESLIIYSPFVSVNRTSKLINLLTLLSNKGAEIYVITRPPNEQFGHMQDQAEVVIEKLKEIGVRVSFRSKMHQKVAIIDKKIAWEGSLNILSHNDSEEQMRRIEGDKTIEQILNNLGFDKGNKTGNTIYSQKKEWETSICYWSLEQKPGYKYSKKKNAWYKRK